MNQYAEYRLKMQSILVKAYLLLGLLMDSAVYFVKA